VNTSHSQHGLVFTSSCLTPARLCRAAGRSILADRHHPFLVSQSAYSASSADKTHAPGRPSSRPGSTASSSGRARPATTIRSADTADAFRRCGRAGSRRDAGERCGPGQGRNRRAPAREIWAVLGNLHGGPSPDGAVNRKIAYSTRPASGVSFLSPVPNEAQQEQENPLRSLTERIRRAYVPTVARRLAGLVT
jgi:hypothetical protein